MDVLIDLASGKVVSRIDVGEGSRPHGLKALADGRLLVWAGFTVGWLALMLLFGRRSRGGTVTGIVPTEAMVERFDLLVIIVLAALAVVGVEILRRQAAREFPP